MYRSPELQGYKVSGLQACPTDINNADIKHDLSRSGGVTKFQDYMVTRFQGSRVQRFKSSRVPGFQGLGRK
jgi:hypothetical protein